MAALPIYLEVGKSKTFACALDWPGWCRSARREDEAIDRLLEYADRYSPVVDDAGGSFPKTFTADVVERIGGDGSTDFGVPGKTVEGDRRPLSAAAAKKQAAILQAAWRALDAVAASAPAELRKGPRGGGRDRDDVVRHVVEAERGYARLIGVRHKPFDPIDLAARQALRDDVVAAFVAARAAEPPHEKGWLPRYALRRFTWHVLDHVWEIEDRSQ